MKGHQRVLLRAMAAGAAALALGLSAPAVAQGTGSGGDGGPGATASAEAAAPYLAPDHWVLDALRRLDGLGLLDPGYDPGLPGVTRLEALRMLETAVARTREGPGSTAALVEGYRSRFAKEYPGATGGAAGAGRAPGSVRWGGHKLLAGYRIGDGDMLTSVGTPPLDDRAWEPTQPATLEAHRRDLVVGGTVSAYWGSHAALQAGGVLEGDDLHLLETYVVGAAGPVDAWVGRRRPRIGYADGGIIVSGALPVDGVGVAVDRFRLPWALERIGDIRVSTSLGQLDHVAPYDDPWLWLLRATVQPHSRLRLGLNRGAMAVAVDGGLGQRLQQAAYIVIGKHMAETQENWRDNQMASVDLRYRPPLGPVPLTLHLEWGLDDSAGSWRDVPGIVAGAHLAAVPGLPWVGAGVQRTHFAERCCGNIWWYRHSGFTGGWTDDRRPLGHPLGGHGDEWLGRLDATSPDGRRSAHLRLHHRERGDENLFAPAFEGASTGWAFGFSGMILGDLELALSAEYERGERWARTQAELRLGLLF